MVNVYKTAGVIDANNETCGDLTCEQEAEVHGHQTCSSVHAFEHLHETLD